MHYMFDVRSARALAPEALSRAFPLHPRLGRHYPRPSRLPART